MNILVAKNGSQLGPFSENEIRAKLASGEFGPADFGWHEGLTAWSPLSQLVGGAGSPPPAPQPQAYAPQPYAAPQPQAQYSAPGTYNSPYPSSYQQGMMPPWNAQGVFPYAGFWRRFLAQVIDFVILYIPLAIIGVVVVAMLRDRSAGDVDSAVMGIMLLVDFVYFFGVWLYFAVMESSARQATFGKMALGMKVTDLAGNRIGFGQATGRFFGKFVSGFIFLVGYVMAAFTERKQALHDMMASTLVLKK